MSKAADAFRTISEVADELEVPKHVLRFWENRFPQIKPMKRGGGRRYYRPADLDLLRGIRHLLHNEGFTIKGVQKILREQGIETVKSCWQGGGQPEKAATLPGPAAKRGVNADREAKRGKATRAPVKLDRKALLLRIAEELRTCRAILAGEERAPSVPRRASARR